MTPRTYYVHHNKTTGGYMNSPYACVKLFYDARSAKVYDPSKDWKPIAVHIIPAADYAAMQAIVEAARTLVDGASTAPESKCEWCGDGKTAVAHLADMDGLRAVANE